MTLVSQIPHADEPGLIVNCAVLTVSDTRTVETDRSGQLIQQLLQEAGKTIVLYTILKDEPVQIRDYLVAIGQNPTVDVVICNGGTGIAPRDTTYEAIEELLEKILPGFGELFRWLSYQEIGSRAIASRAVAGIYQSKLLFSVPGSSHAVQLAMEKLILPELNHLVNQISKNRT